MCLFLFAKKKAKKNQNKSWNQRRTGYFYTYCVMSLSPTKRFSKFSFLMNSILNYVFNSQMLLTTARKIREQETKITNIIFYTKISLFKIQYPRKIMKRNSIKQMKQKQNLCTTTITKEKLQFFLVSKNRFPFNVQENCDFIEQLFYCQWFSSNNTYFFQDINLNSKIQGSWTLTLFYIIVFPHCFHLGKWIKNYN